MKRKIVANGIEYPSIAQACRELNVSVSPTLVNNRINKGWDIEDAFFISVDEALQRKNDNLLHIRLTDYKQRFAKYGYVVIGEYINNVTPTLCIDKDGYRVMPMLVNVERGGVAMPFSVTANAENFIYNINHYCELNKINCVAKEWKMGKHNQPQVLFVCECGKEYWRNFNTWKTYRAYRCLSCVKTTSRYEKEVMTYLDSVGVDYVAQYKFDDCKAKRCLPFDFYLPNQNLCIEIDGEQHFKENSEKFQSIYSRFNYETRAEYDDLKTEYCLKHNIRLIRISYIDMKNGNYKNILKSITD